MTNLTTCSGAGGRGCACAFHVHRRVYHRKHAARRRAGQLEQLQLRSHRCPRKAGPGQCGGLLETYIDGTGRTRVRCPLCERRKVGVCRDCGAPVAGLVGRALRCATHKETARRRQLQAFAERHADEIRARARAAYQDEDVRRRRNEYKRLYRKLHPDKVRAQKERYIAKHAADPDSKYNRYHRRYRAKYRLQKQLLERERLVAAPPPRKTSPKCTQCGKSTRWKPVPRGHSGRPWTVCTACLFPGARKIRLRSRRRQLARAKAWVESLPSPAQVKRPPNAAPRGPGWERTCITPDCDRVVTHRKKKCTKCRERDAQLAASKLETQRGRGRRTDLERVA